MNGSKDQHDERLCLLGIRELLQKAGTDAVLAR